VIKKLRESLFISVEGGEGVGKSTFITGLEKTLSKLGRNVIVTREPGGTLLADRIREVFTHGSKEEPFTVEAELMLVSAARSQHVSHLISPALREGKMVICDRFADSTRVYQGYLGKIDNEFMENIIDKTIYGRHPDITFLLDCDTEISQKRIHNRSLEEGQELSRYDAAADAVHKDLREGFLFYAKKFSERFVVLDASKNPAHVLEQALIHLEERYGFDFS